MGIMGSAFGRALGGFGAGVATLANKYIDEDLAKQRAQAMADIQVATAGKIREQDDAFRNDPTRLARDRGAKRDDALAAGATAREVELAALNDATLQGTRQQVQGKNNEFARGEKVKDITAISPAEAEAAAASVRATGKAEGDVTKQFGNDPLYIAAQRKLAAAKHIESADSVARAELVRMEIGDRKRLGGLYDELARLDGDTTMPEKDKAAKVRAVTGQIMAIRGKNGQGGGGETDTVKITDEKMNADGSTTKTERTEKRRAGQGGASDPLADIAAQLAASRKPGEKAAAKPASAVQPAAPRGPDTGVEGLSTFALRAIAKDPSNPNYRAAVAALEGKQRQAEEVNRLRMSDPSTDPALYQ